MLIGRTHAGQRQRTMPTSPAAWLRREPGTRRWRLGHLRFASVLLISTILLLSGCAVLAKMIPGVPWLPDYWANRDGVYYVGSRCSQSLTEIGVFLAWPTVSESDPSYFSTAVWHAIAPRGVPEFELYATHQPGVKVIADDGHNSFSRRVLVEIRSDDGHRPVGGGGIPSAVGNNLVGSRAGVMSWDDFLKIPNSDFGCR